MPTAASNTYDYQVGTPSRNPELAKWDRYQVKPSATLDPGAGKKFIVVGIVTATGKIAAYASGNSDGTQVARGLLAYKVVTDSGGKITAQGGSLATSQTEDSAEIYIAGYFDMSTINGLDATAISTLKAIQKWGAADLSTGELYIPG